MRVNREDLIEVLQDLVNNERTGTAYVPTDANQCIRIGLRDGRIVACALGTHRGAQEVIQRIQRIDSAQYSFVEDVIQDDAQPDFPETRVFLGELETALRGGIELREESGIDRLAHDDAATESTNSGPLKLLGTELFEVVAGELAMKLGPLGRMVATRYRQELTQAVDSIQVRALVSRLSKEIADSSQAETFRDRVITQIT